MLARPSLQGCGWAGLCALPPAPSASARVPCAARLPRAAPDLALAWPARCCATSPMLGARHPRRRAASGGARCPSGGLRCSAPSMRAQACPPAALRPRPWHAVRRTPRCVRKAVGGCASAATYAAPRNAGRHGRARSALRALTRRDCSSAANAVSGASFATGRELEYRREPFAQRRAAAFERRRIPARGFACSGLCEGQTSNQESRP